MKVGLEMIILQWKNLSITFFKLFFVLTSKTFDFLSLRLKKPKIYTFFFYSTELLYKEVMIQYDINPFKEAFYRCKLLKLDAVLVPHHGC